MDSKWRALAERAGQWKYVLLVAALGLALLLWPSGRAGRSSVDESAGTVEARLEALLSRMEGVGQVKLLLSDSGAAVVCQGADRSAVRLAVTEAVKCCTGLGADKIVIYKMTESEG